MCICGANFGSVYMSMKLLRTHRWVAWVRAAFSIWPSDSRKPNCDCFSRSAPLATSCSRQNRMLRPPVTFGSCCSAATHCATTCSILSVQIARSASSARSQPWPSRMKQMLSGVVMRIRRPSVSRATASGISLWGLAKLSPREAAKRSR